MVLFTKKFERSMRKIIVLLLGILCFFFVGVTSVSAGGGACTGCVEWNCQVITDPITGGSTSLCVCVNEICGQICGPGFYSCNGGCCPIGPGVGGTGCTTTNCQRGCTGGTQGAACGTAANGQTKYMCTQPCDTGGCTPNCSGQACGDDGCGGSCGSCGAGVCVSNTYCCTNTAPSAPTLSSPVNAAQVRVGVPVSLSWTPPTGWGVACLGSSLAQYVCVSSNQTTCDFLSTTVSSTANTSSWTPTVGDAYTTWAVRADNGALSTWSAVRSMCVEGFSTSNTSYVSNWTACDANHIHTRTCREDCGTDDCSTVTLSESCQGVVRGTLFDASEIDACPAFDAVTGYSTGIPAGKGIANGTFDLVDSSVVPPHPWSLLSPAQTDANGNYSISVYAPANYNYDFTSLGDRYLVSSGPKLTCVSNVASVPTNPITCQTQPCSVLNGMSFGFWRVYSGWWQVVGGNVHGEKGITSTIPSSLPTEMSLILPNAAWGNRRGFLSYDTQIANMLGSSANAKVSTSLWEKQSKYTGSPVYDWSFYNKRFNNFAKTTWGDGQAVSYDDKGLGYQIFVSNAGITSFDFSPTGTQKAIFLVNGDVRITSDIVVPNGAFLSIIADGTITFDPAVARADGWYVGNRISIPCVDVDGVTGCDKTDQQFLGNGSFVAWGNIDMTRDRGLTNNTSPSEKFTYRPDIFENAPAPMKVYTKVFKPFIP